MGWKAQAAADWLDDDREEDVGDEDIDIDDKDEVGLEDGLEVDGF